MGKRMDRRAFLHLGTATVLLGASRAAAGVATEVGAGALPPPQVDGGKPLMAALRDRRSSRNFKPDPIPPQVLSNLLWAAFGVNRPGGGGRTAPSASNSQEVDIFVAAPDGLYLFEPRPHALTRRGADDLRALTGRQDFVKDAPINLIYVSDLSRMTRAAAADRESYAAAHTGFISQNVYLFCASEGLATVVRANLDRPPLARAMGLRPEQRITLAQTVGYPR
jgi:nitroreductase